MEADEFVYNVIIAPAASDRMYDHFEFLARVNEMAARKLLDGLTKDINSLERMPFRNPTYDRPFLQSGKYRYKISCGRYRIVYQIGEGNVFIDDIQDCRQCDDNNLLTESE